MLIPSQFPTEIKEVKFDPENDSVNTFLLEVDMESNEFETWLKMFENSTKTNYTIRKQNSKGKLYERSIYAVCHHNTYGDASKGYKHGSKNTHCQAKIEMKKPLSIIAGMKTTARVSIDFKHNHPILAADALRFRKPSQEMKDKFLKLFQNGHTPATAMQANNLEIFLENPDNYEMMLADNSLSPNYQWISRLYNKEAEASYGTRNLSYIEQANLILQLANSKGCYCKIVEEDGQVAIVLLTSLMQRVSQMSESSEICFVDSSGGVDKDGTRFFIFLGKCLAGGVPLAVVLTTSESQIVLTSAFECLKELLPQDAFGGRSSVLGPMVFMTDDSNSERNALKAVWPEAVLLLCIFHVLQAIWRWLFNKKHGITLNDRSILYKLARNMMYAKNEAELETFYRAVLSDVVALKYNNYISHIESLYERKAEWALCFRQELLIRGNNTNNICESAMMVMKDYVMQRVKAYNAVQLADFVISRLDLYFEQKLLNVSFNRTSRCIAKKLLFQKNVEFAKGKIIQEEDFIYSVPSEEDSSKRYVVNMDLSYCECFVGKDGKLCKHQIAVVEYMGVTNRNILPLNDPKQKQYLYNIATGKAVESSFFLTLRGQTKNCDNGKQNMHNNDNSNNINSHNEIGKPSDADLGHDTACEVDNTQLLCNDEEMLECPNQDKMHHSEDVASKTESLKSVFDDLLCKLKTKPDIYSPAIETFTKMYQNLKTDANVVSSLHNFGKTLQGSGTSANVYALKRKGKKIRVQPTAISRRCHMGLGKGSSSGSNIGRPRKPSVLNEHRYASANESKKAPHNLARCVSSNSSVGR